MILRIRYGFLADVINMLYDIPLIGIQSRHRTRLIGHLRDKLDQIKEEEKMIIAEHCNLDHSGQPIILTTEDGRQKFDIKDIEAYSHDRQEFFNEEVVIAGEEHRAMLETVKDFLDNSTKEWSGKEAELYHYLCEQLEGEN